MSASASAHAGNPPDDPRLGDHIVSRSVDEVKLIQSEDVNRRHVVIVGFPYDEGTRRNNGRVGAAKSPAAFRRHYARLGPIVNAEYRTDLRAIHITDNGDVDTDDNDTSLESAHAALQRRLIAILHANNTIPFIIGGSNDQSYPNACAAMSAYGRHLTVINIDAHLDVRPLVESRAHSGSPFRQLLEDKRFCGKLIEFATQSAQCSAQHARYVEQHNGQIYWLNTMRAATVSVVDQFISLLDAASSEVFVSFDIDSVQMSDCPGVSCGATVGLTSFEALQICLAAGRCRRVVMFDLSELNVEIEEYQSTRLAVMMFYYFALGVSQRPKPNE